MTTSLEERLPGLPADPTELIAATPGQRAVFAVSWLDAEVNNGGFHQFFFNPTGALASEALGGARLMGLREHAAVIEEAYSLFPNGEVPVDFDERLALHQALSDEKAERIEPCDERWYELAGPSGEALYEALAGFIRANPEEFFRD